MRRPPGLAEYSANASQRFRAIAASVWTLPGRGMSVDSGASPSGTAGTTDIRYGSFASFSDPDGNGWLLQEITTRLPGR